MKNRLLFWIKTALLVTLFQVGCMSEANSAYKNEINIVLKSGEQIYLPSDCEQFDEVIKGCKGLVYLYLGDRWGIDLHEIQVSEPESDSYVSGFLIHGGSKTVMGGFRSVKVSPDKKRAITSDGIDLYWFPHRFEIYKIGSNGFELEFSQNFKQFSPYSKSKFWIGEVYWVNGTEVVFELYDNQERKIGKSFRLIFDGNSWELAGFENLIIDEGQK
ncbi:MAG TPA: hypothetical protein VF268_10255 [Gammaproteobacteria bacterium]